jgi:flavin-binding protein dodecin
VDTPADRRVRISKELWLAAAEKALVRNTNTFSVLHINDILDQRGLVSQLQANGYKVEISSR